MPSVSAVAVATAAELAIDAFQQSTVAFQQPGVVLEDTRVAVQRSDDREAYGSHIAPRLTVLGMASSHLLAEVLLGLLEPLVALPTLTLPRSDLPAKRLRVGLGATTILGGLTAIGLGPGIGTASILTKLAANVAKLPKDSAQIGIAVTLALSHGHKLTTVTGRVNVRVRYVIILPWHA